MVALFHSKDVVPENLLEVTVGVSRQSVLYCRSLEQPHLSRFLSHLPPAHSSGAAAEEEGVVAMDDVSFVSECDFSLNDGEVTIVSGNGDVVAGGQLLKQDGCKQDGSDSGVELNGAERSASPLPSTPRSTTATPSVGTPVSAPSLPGGQAHLDYDGTSEGGSESSSVLSHTPVRKKVSSTSSSASSSTPIKSGVQTPRSKSVVCTKSAPTGSPVPSPRARDRGCVSRGSSCTRGRQGSASEVQPAARTLSRSQRSSGAVAVAANNNSLMTSSLTESLTLGASSNNVRGRGASRTSVAPRPSSRVSGTMTTSSTDDGRWPSTVQRPTTLSRSRAASLAPDRERRDRDRHVPALTSSSSRNSVNSTNSASTPSPTVEAKCDKFCTIPRRRRRRSVESVGDRSLASSQASSRKAKVTLYHETGSQTALTIQDLEGLVSGKVCQLKPVDAKEVGHLGVQVDRDRDDFSSQMLDRRLRTVIDLLGFEHSGAPRSPCGAISSTVLTPPKEVDHTAWMTSLELLEQRAATIKKRDLLQRNEIGRLRYEVEQNERIRKRQEETEAEIMELHEFLQAEKNMLSESLKEAVDEADANKKLVQSLSEELARQQDECQHLVRVSEQRRQEILTLEARVAALQQRSRESLLQQGAAVTGAAVALSALTSRLDDLAGQLEGSSVDEAVFLLDTEAKAVTTRTKEACRPLSVNLENGFQTLDNVTEPDLDEEGGGHQDSVMSKNDNSSRLVNSESIQNLSAAISLRLQEEAIRTKSNGSDQVSGHLVDQVLDVDTLITRVLRAMCKLHNENV